MPADIHGSKSRIAASLAAVTLSPAERRAAEADLEKGERIADLFIEIMEAVRAGFQRLERGIRALAGSH